MRKKLRVLTVAASLAALAIFSGPAAHAASAVLLDTSGATSGGYSVNSVCSGVIGVARGFNEITYVVEATATGSSTNTKVAVPVGAAVTCRVVDASTGAEYGRVSGGLPGPTAVAAGTVTVPSGATVRAAVCGAAVFSDGGSVSTC